MSKKATRKVKQQPQVIKQGELAKKRILKNQLLKITNGIFSTLTDSLLFISSLPAMSLGQKQT